MVCTCSTLGDCSKTQTLRQVRTIRCVRVAELTWDALEHDQEEVRQTKQDGASHQNFDAPYVPTMYGDAKIEDAKSDLEGAIAQYVEQFA